MGRALGFIGVLIVAAVGLFLYRSQISSSKAEGGQGTPKTVIDVAGVKNYLLAVANAERGHMASEGKYVPFATAQSEVTYNTNANRPYIYSAEIGENSFTITATYIGPPNQGAPQTLSVDQSMQITQE